ncbi:MAG: hypothetical protein R6W06_03675 [Prochlorococcaceae cyanobacterium]
MSKVTALAALFLTACTAHGLWHYLGYRSYEAAVERCQKAYATYPAAFQNLCRVAPSP